MARHCREVVGIDFSNAFIAAADSLRSGSSVPYTRREEASVATPLLARLPAGLDASRTRFLQGDAMHLPAGLGSFDRVHAANLLCRLTAPTLLLDSLPSLVNPGGELVLATPCTWLEEFTSPANWPSPDTFSWLRSRLAPSFDLVSSSEEPFLIRETARKFQWSFSLVTLWRRHPLPEN